jgi:hypothetical protein
MLEFVKGISIEDNIRKRLVMDTSNFVDIDRYDPSAAFPDKFSKGTKFDCILADLGINTYFSIFIL